MDKFNFNISSTCGSSNDTSRWAREQTRMNRFTWASEQVHASRKGSLKIFHITSWNIPNMFIFHVEIIHDVVKYSMTSHGIFYHVTCEICYGINNDLLTLNMDLTNIVVDNSIMWNFELKRKYKDAFYHSKCNQCSKYLRFLYNTFNIFKTVEMTRNCMLEKYLMNFNQ
jgi:hypothetical protein